MWILWWIALLEKYHKYYYWNNQLNRYFNLTIDIYPLLSVPFVWNLSWFFFMLSQLVFKIMWFLPQTVKNFNNCKHNIYCSFCMELDLLMQFIALHFMWDTPWIPTWMKYRVSQVSEYIYMCIFYDLKLFQINVLFGWWCLLYNANLNQPLNQLKL